MNCSMVKMISWKPREMASQLLSKQLKQLFTPRIQSAQIIELKKFESRPKNINSEGPSPNVLGGKRRCHGSHEQKQTLEIKDQV